MTTQNNTTPVPVTRGWKQKSVSLKIDWLEGTFPKFRETRVLSSLPQTFRAGRALNGYTVAKLYDDGRIEMTNPENPRMGTHLIWSSKALPDDPEIVRQLVKFQLEAGMRVTRIDLAVDAINWRLKPSRATKEIKNGDCKTRAKKFDHHDDALAVGETQYIGRKASTLYCRIYDKAAELGVPGDHTRIELVARQQRANSAANAVVRNPDFRPLVKAYVDFPHWPVWNSVMGADVQRLPAEERGGATERWLMEVCAPSLARVLDANPDSDFLHNFLVAVAVNRREAQLDETA